MNVALAHFQAIKGRRQTHRQSACCPCHAAHLDANSPARSSSKSLWRHSKQSGIKVRDAFLRKLQDGTGPPLRGYVGPMTQAQAVHHGLEKFEDQEESRDAGMTESVEVHHGDPR
jgi:hypothetical protein